MGDFAIAGHHRGYDGAIDQEAQFLRDHFGILYTTLRNHCLQPGIDFFAVPVGNFLYPTVTLIVLGDRIDEHAAVKILAF